MYMGHVLVCTGEGTLAKGIRLVNMYSGAESSEGDNGGANEHFVSRRMNARRSEEMEGMGETEQFVLEGVFGEDIRKLTGMLLRH